MQTLNHAIKTYSVFILTFHVIKMLEIFLKDEIVFCNIISLYTVPTCIYCYHLASRKPLIELDVLVTQTHSSGFYMFLEGGGGTCMKLCQLWQAKSTIPYSQIILRGCQIEKLPRTVEIHVICYQSCLGMQPVDTQFWSSLIRNQYGWNLLFTCMSIDNRWLA